MRTEANLSAPTAEEMRQLIAGLTPAERRLLNDPNFVTEDEADVIMALRDDKEPGRAVSLDELFRENGQTRRRKR